MGSKSISIVDLASGRLLDTIPLGMNPARVLALSPRGDMLYAGFERAPLYAQFSNNVANGNVAQTTQPFQNMTSNVSVSSNDSLLGAFNTVNGAITRYDVPGLQKVLALAVSPNDNRLYIYARVSTNGSASQTVPRGSGGTGGTGNIHVFNNTQAMQQQAQSANPESDKLLVFDLKEKRVVRQLGSYGGLASVTVSPDGARLYLIGTPGDPAQEAALHAKVAQQYTQANTQNNNTPPDIIADLSRIRKTVTVLDAATGRKLAVYTVGSLPQGSAWLP